MRMLKLAEFLAERGHRVHVLAGRGREHSDFGYGATLQRLNIHYVDDPALRIAGGAPGRERAKPTVAAHLKAMIRPIALELATPDTGVLALGRFIAAGKKLIREHGITTIISSGPPHSDHLVALVLQSRHPEIRWIADYRDSWNGTPLFRKRLAPMQWLNLALERAVLKRANHVSAISPPMLDKLTVLAGGGFDVSKLKLIMNGFDSNIKPPSVGLSNILPLRIGYFGAIDDRADSYRNPATFFEALSNCPESVRVELFGPARFETDWQQRLNGRLVVHGTLPHAEAAARMAEFDVLMLLHTRREGADEVITGKVFEYLSSGRPILSVGPADMAVNAMFAHDPLFFSVDHDDVERQIGLLSRLAERKANGDLGTRTDHDIAQYSRQAQYERLLAMLQ